MLGPHCVAHWGKQQDKIALSTAEAELKSSCKAMVEMLGVQNIQAFLTGRTWKLEHVIDASATEKIIHRQGAGPLKHLDVRSLWIQEARMDHKVRLIRVPRSENYADICCSVPYIEPFTRMFSEMRFTFPSCPGQGG